MSLTVFNYHGILDGEKHSLLNFDGKHIEKTEFKKQFLFIKKHYSILSLSGLKRCFLEKSLPKNAALLTFDDAYSNIFENARPLLESFAVPAVFFIPAGLVGKKSFLPQDLLLKAIETGSSFSFRGETYRPKTIKQKISFYYGLKKELLRLQKNSGKKAGDDFLEKLFRDWGLSKRDLFDESFSLLSWGQIKKMGSSGLFEFGSHTLNHIPIAGIPIERARIELSDSKKIIEKKTGFECFSFAYPFGAFDEQTKKLAGKMFFLSFTTQFGKASFKTEKSAIPRISLNNNYNSLFPLTIFLDIPQLHARANSLVFALKNYF